MSTQKALTPYEAEWVTVTEFIRRKHRMDVEKDALARPVAANTVNSKLNAGSIAFRQEGKRRFIDWNRYKDYPLRTYFQMPTQQQKIT